MTEHTKKPAMDARTPLDLEGSEHHHDLKNQPGDAGDPDHTDMEDNTLDDSVADAIAQTDAKGQLGDAMKKATD